jgi:P4 family phage/plasmid primase-like protien
MPYIQGINCREIAISFGALGARVFVQTECKEAMAGSRDDAASDPEEIKKLFEKGGKRAHSKSGKYHTSAGAYLPDGWYVLDVDIKNDSKGDTELEKILNGQPMIDTLTVRTGSGGKHYYFKSSEKLNTGNIEGYTGLEIKNRITLPGSLYEGGADYRIINNIEPVAMPQWLIDLSKTIKNKSEKYQSFDIEKSEIKVLPGERDDFLFRRGCSIRSIDFDYDVIFSELKKLNYKYCEPPLPMERVKIQADGAFKYPPIEYFLDDVSDSKRLADYLQDNFRWCSIHNCWYYYGLGAWRRDEEELRIQEETKDAMVHFLKLFKHVKDKNSIAHFKAILRNFSRIKRILECMRSAVAIRVDDFDKNHMMFNCNNGTFNLNDLSFATHNRKEYHTKQANVNFDEKAETPKIFIDFINDIFKGDQELIRYVQKILGYSLTGGIGEQEFYIFYGEGNNGKSQLIRCISLVMDSYAHHLGADKIMADKHRDNSTYLAQLKNIRALFCSESGNTRTLDSDLLKTLTGEYEFTVAQKYEKPIKFKISAKVFLVTNNKPNIKDTTEGMWRRVRLIPFTYEVPKEKRIKDYGDVLYAAGPSGILNWLLEGYKLYRIEGLEPPASVKKESQEYRNEEDLLLQFLNEKCVKSESSKLLLADIFKKFEDFAKDYNLHVTIKRLAKDLRSKKYFIEHSGEGKRVCGIAWKAETTEAVADAPLLAPPVTAAPAPVTSEEEAMRKAGLF